MSSTLVAHQDSTGRLAVAAIEVRGLTKRYRKGPLANDAIDLTIPRGAVFGLLGPNGAGKTTLVRQMTGELTPTAGEIRVLGADVVQEPLRAKGLRGIVPQEANLLEHLTAREHLVFFSRLRGLGAPEAGMRADEAMAALGLTDHARQTPQQLSGGLKRKVMVGIALATRPPVLVLDEPTTGLDPHSRREVWALLRSLLRDGTTVLVTTHYMDEAEELCDTIAVIGSGRILAQGTIEELRGLCTNRYKAAFAGRNGGREIVYGRTHDEVVSQVADLGVQEYSLVRASLEDLYLELTGRALEEAEIA